MSKTLPKWPKDLTDAADYVVNTKGWRYSHSKEIVIGLLFDYEENHGPIIAPIVDRVEVALRGQIQSLTNNTVPVIQLLEQIADSWYARNNYLSCSQQVVAQQIAAQTAQAVGHTAGPPGVGRSAHKASYAIKYDPFHDQAPEGTHRISILGVSIQNVLAPVREARALVTDNNLARLSAEDVAQVDDEANEICNALKAELEAMRDVADRTYKARKARASRGAK